MPTCPYKGLTPYGEEDAQFFFGRKTEREVISANIMASRLTLLYGKSGVGKSSVLYAGVVPHLRQVAQRNLDEHGVPELAVVVMNNWRDDPLAELAKQVQNSVQKALGKADQDTLPACPTLLETFQVGAERVGGELVVICDQFEEYFLYHPGEKGQGTFFEEFPRTLNQEDLRVSFLIAIREDALAKLDLFKGRIPNLFDNHLRIDHLSKKGAYEAIVKPIERFNQMPENRSQQVNIEPGLVDAVLEKIPAGETFLDGQGKGVAKKKELSTPDKERIETPYLQLVMFRLWKEEEKVGSSILRLATMRRLGGVANIVRTHLDDSMNMLLPWEKDLAALIFLFLVTPSGSKIALDQLTLSAFTKIQESYLSPVLLRLASKEMWVLRTVSPATEQPAMPRFEIFHDVMGAAILDWRTRYLRKKEKAEAERQLLEERKRVRKLILSIVGLVLVLFLVIGLGTYAWLQKEIRFSREIASHALNRLAIDPELSVLLAQQGEGRFPYLSWVPAKYRPDPNQIEDALRRSLSSSLPNMTLTGENGHTDEVKDIAFYQGGRFLVSASRDSTIKIWNVESGEVQKTLNGHGPGGVESVAISPGENLLATGGHDSTLRLWELPSANLLQELSDNSPYPVISVKFHPQDNLFVSTEGVKETGIGGSIRFWEIVPGQESQPRARQPEITFHDKTINNVKFSPNGRFLATVSNDATAGVWDLASPQNSFSLEGHQTYVSAIAFDRSGKHLATGSWDNTAQVWALDTQTHKLTLGGHVGAVYDVVFGPDDKCIVTGSRDGTARMWNAKTGALELILSGHKGEVVALDTSGTLLATASRDHTVKVWNIGSGPYLLGLCNHTDDIVGLAFSPDGNHLATASYDGTGKWWNRNTGKEVFTFRMPTDIEPENRVYGIAVSQTGLVATASKDGRARVWDSRTGQELETYPKDYSDVLPAMLAVAFNSDGNLLAMGNSKGLVQVWNRATGEKDVNFLENAKGAVRKLMFSPDGKYLAVAMKILDEFEGKAYLWDLSARQKTREFCCHDGTVMDITFNHDGSKVATVGIDKKAVLWETHSGIKLGTFEGHSQHVKRVAFSPDGKWLATASDDKTAKVWNIESGKELMTIYGHLGPVNQVAFSPDGKYLATASEDITVRIHPLKIEDLKSLAEKRITRSLTPSECQQYLHMETC